MNSIERVEFMFEDINGKFDFIVEAVSVLQRDVAEMKPLVVRIPNLENDILDVNAVATGHSKQLRSYDVRLLRLENQ